RKDNLLKIRRGMTARASMALHRFVPIGHSAGTASFLSARRHPAPDLEEVVLAVELADQTAKPDKYRARGTLMNGTDFDAQK
ncbi:MAG: hypothetical protein AAFY42_13140, partial [Pseudomonadota bacterium]